MTELEAELYALTHRGNPGDAEFYARQCAGAGSVLELGTGYGRLLPSLLSAAREVVGLDREPSLLRAARRQQRGTRGRLTLLEADMQSFALGRRFDRIVLPYNALYCLLGRRALVSCFRSVRAHLAPGGGFLFDVWAADPFQRRARLREAHRDEPGAIVSLAHRGQVWDVFESSRLRSAAQRLDVTYTYVSRQRGTRAEIAIAQRYATSGELEELLAVAGLRLRGQWGGLLRAAFRAAFGAVRGHGQRLRHVASAAGARCASSSGTLAEGLAETFHPLSETPLCVCASVRRGMALPDHPLQRWILTPSLRIGYVFSRE